VAKVAARFRFRKFAASPFPQFPKHAGNAGRICVVFYAHDFMSLSYRIAKFFADLRVSVYPFLDFARNRAVFWRRILVDFLTGTERFFQRFTQPHRQTIPMRDTPPQTGCNDCLTIRPVAKVDHRGFTNSKRHPKK
jgi:hypothetical protein